MTARASNKVIGCKYISLNSVGSTNDYLKSIYSYELPEGLIVEAQHQTSGKGRNGKKWHSVHHENLQFSIFLKPRISTDKILLFSYIPVIILTLFLRKQFQIQAVIKWPNDILVNKSKIAGILTETVLSGHQLKYLIIGIGVNLFNSIVDFGIEMDYLATSVQQNTEKQVEKYAFLADFLNEFDLFYRTVFVNTEWEQWVIEQWNSLCLHINTPVYVLKNNKALPGIFKGIGYSGEALIDTGTGLIKIFNIEEISLKL